MSDCSKEKRAVDRVGGQDCGNRHCVLAGEIMSRFTNTWADAVFNMLRDPVFHAITQACVEYGT